MVQEEKWDISRLVITSTSLELEYLSDSNHSMLWKVHRFHPLQTALLKNMNSDVPFPITLRQAILGRHEKAEVFMIPVNGLMWLAIIYKEMQEEELFKKPITIAISDDKKYLFTKKTIPLRLTEALKTATRSRKIQPLKLNGPNVPSLLKLLRRRHCSNTIQRPVFVPNAPETSEVGTNFLQVKSCDDYTEKCFPDGLHLNQYTVEAAEKKWLGDDSPELRLIEFKHEISFSGNVPRILRSLPSAGICHPPFPEYIRDFSILGRSKVTITSSYHR